MMLDRLLIALRLKKKAAPKALPAFTLRGGLNAQQAPSRMQRYYAAPAVAPSAAPAPDTSSDLMNAMFLTSLLNSSTGHESSACSAPEPFRSGGGGDFGGGGAIGSWDAPAPSPSYDSGSSDSSSSSSSNDSSSSSSSSSD